MAQGIVTSTLERWAGHRHRNAGIRLALWVLGGVALLGALAVVSALFLPELRFVPILCGFLALATVVAGAVLRAPRPELADLSIELDRSAQTHGLLRTAVDVEANRAVGGEVERAAVLRRASVALPQLEPLGRPALDLPLPPFAALGLAAVVIAGALAIAVVGPLPNPGPGRDLPEVSAGFSPEVRHELERAVAQLDALSEEPGLDPNARAAILAAHDSARAALIQQDDAQVAAGELDRARSALHRLERGAIYSDKALAAARSSHVARGLDKALAQGDSASARRLAEEVLRRVESERSEGELRRLGRELAEGEASQSSAADAKKRAGQQLAGGDRSGTLSALSDLMAALGEPTLYEPRPKALDQASDAVDKARQQAVEQLERAEGASDPDAEGRGAGREKPGADGPAVAEGEGEAPSPVDLPSEGGEPDAGPLDPDEALREGQGLAPQEPSVAAESGDAPREEGEGEADRTAAGEGAASADTPMSGDGGAGEGAPAGEAGEAGEGRGAPSGSQVSTSTETPGEGAGQGEGTGASLDGPFAEVEPDAVPADWVRAQWTGAPDAMGDLVRSAEAQGRSTMSWGQVHQRYQTIAEAATRRGSVPLTRRNYIQQYFEAIRPEPSTEQP
ncbi:MAG: hypothetical protein EA397_07700 [Deltaproteobacteria bacterium]|nr:MAG: hypothetical protein EA397_07700 [Deltaproteobacteria bacterium]